MSRHKPCSLGVSQEIVSESLCLGILRHVDGAALVDSRGLLGTEAGRSLIVRALSRHVGEFGSDVLIGGVANSGSVLGALLADRLDLPFVNLLVDGPRTRGLRRQVEPDDSVAGQPVLAVDNWIASGSSFLDAARLVADAGGAVVGALTVSASPTFSPDDFPIPVHVGIPLARLIR